MSLDQAKKAEISEIQSLSSQTKRATVPALEEILYEPLKVLDHGFVRTIDYMGDDAAIVQAARVSYGTGTKKISEDQGLINYLMRHRHTTPFEMCEIKYHIKLPIFIARQWIRHRTANVNEYSGRYSIMHDEFYIPAAEHLAPQSQDNRQGRSGNLTPDEKKKILDILKKDAELCYEHYTEMMNANEAGEILDPNRTGLARELARMNLTLNYYTEWYWKIDLHNLFHFIGLRADSHAQYEIRAYADVMFDTVKKWVPYAAAAFEEYKMHGTHLSAKGRDVVQKLITGQPVDQKSSGMSPREWRELLQGLQLDENFLPKKISAAS